MLTQCWIVVCNTGFLELSRLNSSYSSLVSSGTDFSGFAFTHSCSLRNSSSDRDWLTSTLLDGGLVAPPVRLLRLSDRSVRASSSGDIARGSSVVSSLLILRLLYGRCVLFGEEEGIPAGFVSFGDNGLSCRSTADGLFGMSICAGMT